MSPWLLARLAAGLVVVVTVGFAVAQKPPESYPFEYYTHRCHPHYNRGKFCVPEVKSKKKNIDIYNFKEIDYCYPRPMCCFRRCLCKMFPCLFPEEEFGCPHCHGCMTCGCVRTKRVLLKKSVPCEKPQVKCRVEYLPCACPPYDPTRKAEEPSKEKKKASGTEKKTKIGNQ